ncbi:MAG TPA: tetratricopeptide repeat protein [Caulobacteraceae bacterium]|jgi:Flp pilus assembly protein TadD
MLLKRVLIATAIAAIAPVVLVGPVQADAAPARVPAMRSVTPVKADTPPAPVKATPAQRAEAERMPLLARAAFWAREADIDQSDAEARIKLARVLRELGRYDEAAASADQLLVMEPNNLDALLESARAKIAANHGFYAIDPAQRAAAIAPRDWRPVSLLAVAFEQTERESDALAAHQKALSLAPNNPATLTNLGMYYATHGAPAQAEPLLRKAVAAPGAGAQERQNLALVLGMQSKFAEAEQLERQDLPPEVVTNNLAYLHAITNSTPDRTWNGLKSDQ